MPSTGAIDFVRRARHRVGLDGLEQRPAEAAPTPIGIDAEPVDVDQASRRRERPTAVPRPGRAHGSAGALRLAAIAAGRARSSIRLDR
jgi:hypothetical protein